MQSIRFSQAALSATYHAPRGAPPLPCRHNLPNVSLQGLLFPSILGMVPRAGGRSERPRFEPMSLPPKQDHRQPLHFRRIPMLRSERPFPGAQLSVGQNLGSPCPCQRRANPPLPANDPHPFMLAEAFLYWDPTYLPMCWRDIRFFITPDSARTTLASTRQRRLQSVILLYWHIGKESQNLKRGGPGEAR